MWKNQRCAQRLCREMRVSKCQRKRKGHFVTIRRSGSGRASYAGLETCSSVWVCPCCNGKICEDRRVDLQAAVNAWVGQGGEVYLMTLTYPHEKTLSLIDSRSMQRRALKAMKGQRAYKALAAEAGVVGFVRALEVTYGEHGWHPHTHDLVFAARGKADVLRQIENLWINALFAVGLAEPSQLNDLYKAAFDIQNGDYAAEYIAKFGMEPVRHDWGAARELTKASAKIGLRFKGRTPMTLLDEYRRGMKASGALFREFALVFKGDRQLYWSPKLREKIGLSDDEKPEGHSEIIIDLDPAEWNLVVSRDARGDVLQIAEIEGAEGVKKILPQLAARPPTHSDADTDCPGVRFTLEYRQAA